MLRTAFFVKLPNEVDKEPGIFKVLWVSTETSSKSVPVQLPCLINASTPHDLDCLGPVLGAGGSSLSGRLHLVPHREPVFSLRPGVEGRDLAKHELPKYIC